MKFLSYTIILCFFPTIAVAQNVFEEAPRSGNFSLIGPSSVYIWNRGAIKLSFSMSADDSDYSVFTLESDGSHTYYASVGTPNFFIKVDTKGKEAVRYKLNKTGRYSLYWNNQDNRWDVGKMEAR